MQQRALWRELVSEQVRTRLRPVLSFDRPMGHFVQCDQAGCQYADDYKAPSTDARPI